MAPSPPGSAQQPSRRLATEKPAPQRPASSSPAPPIFKEPEQETPPAVTPRPPADQPAAPSPDASRDYAADSQRGEKSLGGPERSGSRGRTNPLALVEPIKTGLTVATSFANEALAADDDERESAVYVIDDTDAQAAAEPLSRIVTRRMREDGLVNPDLADAIAAVVALASYVGKVLRRRAEFRRLRAGAVDHTPPQEAPAA